MSKLIKCEIIESKETEFLSKLKLPLLEISNQPTLIHHSNQFHIFLYETPYDTPSLLRSRVHQYDIIPINPGWFKKVLFREKLHQIWIS